MRWHKEVQARCDAATPGPWRTIEPDAECPDWFISRQAGVSDVPPEKFYLCRMGPRDAADAAFLAHARTDLPRALTLLAEAERVVDSLLTDRLLHQNLKTTYTAACAFLAALRAEEKKT